MRYAFLAATVVLTLSAIAGCTSRQATTADERLPRQVARCHRGQRVGPPSPVRLRVDVYTLHARTKDSMRFSVDALNDKAGDPEALLEALNAYGKADLLYRFDQEIDLGVKTELALVQEMPYAKGVRNPSDGQFQAVTAYWDVGYVLDVSGAWDEAEPRNVAEVLLKIKFSSVGTMNCGSGVVAPIFNERTDQKSVRLTDDIPSLFSILGGVHEQDNEVDGTRAHIVRLQVGRLKDQP